MNVTLDADDLRPLVEAVVSETLRHTATPDDGRLAYPEPEAAALLGMTRAQLRDARLRGEITATKLGGRLGYERGELVAYLARNRTDQ